MMNNKPNFFIVGAPKCGTTALYAYLCQHPAIFMAAHKECHFFADDLDGPNYIRDLSTYMSLFSKSNGERAIGEASVWYLYSERAAQAIYEFNPDAKIIIMLRNPVDMIYSYHGQRLFDGKEDCLDFGEALALEPMRKQGKCLPRRPDNPHGLYYSEIALYNVQVARYLQIFPCENIHVIIYDDLKADAKQTADAAITFLGAEVIDNMPFAVVNVNKMVRLPWLRDLVVLPPRWITTGAQVIPEPKRKHVGLRIKRLIKHYNRKEGAREPMDRTLYRQLQKGFEPMVARLSELIQVDLQHWRYQN